MASNNSNYINCSICQLSITQASLSMHMARKHPGEWQTAGHTITYHHCDVPGCGGLQNNVSKAAYHDHLSTAHGLDRYQYQSTTNHRYLARKQKHVLVQHILDQAAGLNRLNARTRALEESLARRNPDPYYRSCHGLDVIFLYEEDPAKLPDNKPGLVLHLQLLREDNNQLGWLYTQPGARGTRVSVYHDLKKLLGDDVGPEEFA